MNEWVHSFPAPLKMDALLGLNNMSIADKHGKELKEPRERKAKLVRDCYVYSGGVKRVQVCGAVSASQLPATAAWLIKAFTETSLVHSVLPLTGYLKRTASNYHEKMEDTYALLNKWSWAGKNATNSVIPISAAGFGEGGMGSWDIEIQRLSLGRYEGGHTSLGHCEGGHTSTSRMYRMNSHRNHGPWVMMCEWGNASCNKRTTLELGAVEKLGSL